MSKKLTLRTKVLLEGLKFPESPRWHDDILWFVDMEGCKVMTIDLNGNTEIILQRSSRVSGLGWLPDNRLLIVAMDDNCLLRLDPNGVNVIADLNKFNFVLSNDMVVDKKGRAYVGSFGFNYMEGEPFAPTRLVLVEPDGTARVVAEDMAFPNGAVITPDSKTLIVAETFAAKLTAFDILDDGSLTNRRVWARLRSLPPDGICLDADGGIWLAAPGRGRAVRVLEGGEITHIVKVENDAYACMLGGLDRKTLFVATSKHTRDAGRIEFVEVDVPGVGLP
ncbi:MAG: 5-valerolactone hydrolase [Candidatus Lokiarchaeota archaeon]|nr:5-valerolactone hydrolase [Candidatus Lokiarchaeota archaeon]